MSDVFRNYKEAYNYAAELASKTGLNMVIRKGKEYGKPVFYTNFKTHDGSDYLGETVTPGQPLANHENGGK